VSIVLLLAILASLVALLDSLPDFFGQTSPWLGDHVALLGVTTQQVLAATVMALAFALFAVVILQVRSNAKKVGPLVRAVDTTITWLYRRDKWDGLSEGGRNREPAEPTYAADKYREIGLVLDHDLPDQIIAEKDFPVARASGAGLHSQLIKERSANQRTREMLAAEQARGARLRSELARMPSLNWAAPPASAVDILPATAAATRRPTATAPASLTVDGVADLLGFVAHLSQGQTEAAASSSLTPYLGLRAVAIGTVYKVSSLPDGRVLVQLDYSLFDDRPSIMLEFSGAQAGRARDLRKGASVKVEGQIEELSESVVGLIECEMI